MLRPGGAHVFTVPFIETVVPDVVMSRRSKHTGRIVHGPGLPAQGLVAPMYHGDPVRPKTGVLVFTLFGQEMVTKLCALGYDVDMRKLENPNLGILGPGAVVFTAWKV